MEKLRQMKHRPEKNNISFMGRKMAGYDRLEVVAVGEKVKVFVGIEKDILGIYE